MIWLILQFALAQEPADVAGVPGILGRECEARGRIARVVRPSDGSSSRVEVLLPDGGLIIVADRHNPDRVTLSADGDHIAWVSGASGLASVWVSRVLVSEPRQLTNIGLEDAPREAGRPPAGWVPPPHDHSLRFEQDHLVWDSPTGPQQVRWR